MVDPEVENNNDEPWYTDVPQSDPGTSPLAEQLGSDTMDVAAGRWDMRRLTFLKPPDMRPLLYCLVRSRKKPVFGRIANHFMNLRVSMDGIGRKQIIHMEQARKGTSISYEKDLIKPGILARNIYNRNWEEKQREELGI